MPGRRRPQAATVSGLAAKAARDCADTRILRELPGLLGRSSLAECKPIRGTQ